MSDYIVDLEVSLNTSEESQLQAQGFTKINVNLNEGAGGNIIYLWYKRGSSKPAIITRIQFSYNEEMTMGLTKTYNKIPKNLNAGTSGNEIYLWYYRGSTPYDFPIVNLDVITEAKVEGEKFQMGWERLECDLNRENGGKQIHLWVKRAKTTYICDIKATSDYDTNEDLFQEGFVRLDEDTNRDVWYPHPPAVSVFIWYRQTTDRKNAIRDLQVSTNSNEYASFQAQTYTSVGQDLNQGTGGNQVYLWFKKSDPIKNAIKAVTVITDRKAVRPYVLNGAQVIPKSLNTGNDGLPEFVCFISENHHDDRASHAH